MTTEYNDHAMLTTEQVAPLVGMKPGTLMEWRYLQKIGQPPYHKVGRSVRYRYSEVVQWLASNMVTSR